MKKIALIGAGQIGSRHLQALGKIDIPISIEVVNPNTGALLMAEKRFEEVPFNTNISSISYFEELNELSPQIDLCIIATKADVRADVIKELSGHKRIRYLILEKVLFQNIEDFELVSELLKFAEIRTWVNCPRRSYPIYKWVKGFFPPGEKISICVEAQDMGLCCNSIHFIDLLSFITGLTDIEIDITGIEKTVFESKRNGFIEFYGILQGAQSNGSNITITSINKMPSLIKILIFGERINVFINETEGTAEISRKEDDWKCEKIQFKEPFQSELTQLVAKDILENGKCDLTDFDDSCLLHKPLLSSFITHLELIKGERVDYCPIT